MTDNDSKDRPPKRIPKEERIDVEEAKRLIAEAEARGEDPMPIVRHLVLSTIDTVTEQAEKRDAEDS